MSSDLLNIEGYSFERFDRKWLGMNNKVKAGGGVCMYIRSDINYSATELSHLNASNNNIECQWLKINQPNMRKIIICNCYRPPTGSVEIFIDYLNDKINSIVDGTNYDIFVMGDMNIDYLKESSPARRSLKNLERLCGLTQIIKQPTRYSTRSSLLDLIFTNSNYILKSGVIDLNLSDHECVFVIRKKEYNIKKTTTKFDGRSYKHYNVNLFQSNLKHDDWTTFYNTSNPDNCWDIMYNKIINHISTMCPVRHFKVKEREVPWITNELIELINDKDRALSKAKKSNKTEDWKKARKLRNDANKATKIAKAKYIQNNLYRFSGDVKKFWKTISELIPKTKKQDKLQLINHKDGILIPEEDTANYVNNYFSSIGKELATKFTEKDIYSLSQRNTANTLEPFITDEEEVISLVKKIDIYKSSSIENLSSRILKDAFLAIPTQLTYLFNISLTTGQFPELWKSALIIPIHKGGDTNDVSNYRPISLLPLPGKLLEKIVHSRIITFLDRHKLLNDNQGGFRPGFSTQDTISAFTDDLFLALNDKETTVACFIDLKKAFDTVNHKILLKKLKSIGLTGTNYKWLASYLHDRKQKTLIGNIKSTSKLISYGVPQGSTLGPLLFLIYINDAMDLNIKSNMKLYADDTVIYTRAKSLHVATNILQQDLNHFAKWCNSNKLTINAKKTKAVIFSSKYSNHQLEQTELTINDTTLHYVDHYKYLGFILDKNLDFKKHINESNKIIAYKIYQLLKIRRFINYSAAVKIYKAMILPYFDYCDFVLISSNQKALTKLQRLQNRALRICLNVNERTSTTYTHEETNTTKLNIRRISHLRNFMYKRSGNKSYIEDRHLSTRNFSAPVMKVTRPKTDIFKRSVLYKGAIEWNALDVETRNIKTLSNFKHRQKCWSNSQPK